MTNETPLLFEEIQSRMHSIVNESLQLYNDLNGNQMDIDCGTRIEILTDAGYVRFSRLLDNSTTLQVWLKIQIPETTDL